MANRYETVFILTPVLSEDQAKEAVGRYKSFLKDNGTKLLHEEKWGLKKLAYPIQKKSTGFYFLLEFEAEGEIIQKLEVEFKRDERIIRFSNIRMDQHHIAFAESRRDRKENKKQVAKADASVES